MTEKQPFNLELERAVLSSILMAPEIRDEIAEILQEDDLHDRRHRTIYRAMLALGDDLADALTLEHFLTEKGTKYLTAAGGKAYLLDLVAIAPSYLLASQHAREVARLGEQRRLQIAGEQIGMAARAHKDDLDKAYSEARHILEAAEKQRKATVRKKDLDLLTSDVLLTTDWPEPVWAIPELLPVGLTILAGKPKVGKSWLALQVAQAVAAGGVALGAHVDAGPILYLALEDPPRRLKERMQKQHWKTGLPADFMPIGQFEKQIADLRNGGGERLARQIAQREYRLVVIDTLSRSCYGDQNDVSAMTAALTPIQEMAHTINCAVLMVDHHHKLAMTDAITDILGSTAKGAMSDTAWGLYRERGKAGAKLAVVGREVIEKELSLTFDGLAGCWQFEGDANEIAMTKNRLDILEALETMPWSTCQDIADAVDRNKGSVYRDLQELGHSGYVIRHGKDYALSNQQAKEEQE